MNTGMYILLNTLDTKLQAGLSWITAATQVLQITRPLPTPKVFPMIYLIPESVEKMTEAHNSDTELMWHKYIINIVLVNSKRTTQEASLINSTDGLIKRMEDIETLLESDTLVKILKGVNIYPVTYDLPEDTFADNIYTRAGSLLYEAETIPYNSTIHRT